MNTRCMNCGADVAPDTKLCGRCLAEVFNAKFAIVKRDETVILETMRPMTSKELNDTLKVVSTLFESTGIHAVILNTGSLRVSRIDDEQDRKGMALLHYAREFMRGCSAAPPQSPTDCKDCTRMFLENVVREMRHV